MHYIDEYVLEEPEGLSRAVAQVADMLGLYRAELARILCLRCEDVGRLLDDREVLRPATVSWSAAQQLVSVYRLLYRITQGDKVAIYHWLRARHAEFPHTPLIRMVDEGGVAQVCHYLRTQVP